MNLFPKRAARRADDRRHKKLMDATRHIVSRASLEHRIKDIDLTEVVALAFGRYQLRITEDDALDYLNAVHAERGFPLRSTHPVPSGSTRIPTQRDREGGDEA